MPQSQLKPVTVGFRVDARRYGHSQVVVTMTEFGEGGSAIETVYSADPRVPDEYWTMFDDMHNDLKNYKSFVMCVIEDWGSLAPHVVS